MTGQEGHRLRPASVNDDVGFGDNATNPEMYQEAPISLGPFLYCCNPGFISAAWELDDRVEQKVRGTPLDFARVRRFRTQSPT